MQKTNIFILGATGMLGHVLLRRLSRLPSLEVHASSRRLDGLERWFTAGERARIHGPVAADDFPSVQRLLEELRPAVVINCIGVIKQLAGAKDPLQCIEINALFPHRLAKACQENGARLVQISTDCVFCGRQGNYRESDFPDCDDLYGRTKLLGEVDYPHAVTLRTSIIGHELQSQVSLVDWFLAQEGKVRGFTQAIYSGFPTVEMARIIADLVIPAPELHGLYHVASTPISKYELLCRIAHIYGKRIDIEPYGEFHCDRSLDGSCFTAATGYRAPEWESMLTAMHDDYLQTAGCAGQEG